jgi:uncharacterized protein YjbI with pentapeptide repeats
MILNYSQKLIQLENIIAETALVAMIRQEPAEISRINRLEFKESYDNLDYLVYAILPLSLGSQVSLVRHKHSLDSGIEICVRHDQKDIARIISETLYELELDRNAITWVVPQYETQLYGLLAEQYEYKKNLSEHLGYSNLSEFDLSKHLSGADLSGMHLKRIQLGRSNLSKAKFIKSELGFADLRKANLEEANLQEVDLRKANLQKAILQHVNLKGSYLQEADLQGVNLQHANLKGADLRGANLQYANLKGADLRGANLERANLKSAILSVAKLDNATLLKGADIGDAKLKDIKWDKDTMWFNIIGLHNASGIPDNLKNHPSFKLGIKLSEAIEELSEHSNLDKFREVYKQVLSEIKNEEIAASLWNKIAWLSCLYGYPDDECYQAALNAVELASSKGNYHDTLGLVLTLRGDYVSAIQEFEIALRSEDFQLWLSDFKDKRINWIRDLRSGENPLNQDVIEVLKIEER